MQYSGVRTMICSPMVCLQQYAFHTLVFSAMVRVPQCAAQWCTTIIRSLSVRIRWYDVQWYAVGEHQNPVNDNLQTHPVQNTSQASLRKTPLTIIMHSACRTTRAHHLFSPGGWHECLPIIWQYIKVSLKHSGAPKTCRPIRRTV